MPLSVSPPMGGVSFPYGVYCIISGGYLSSLIQKPIYFRF